MSGLAEATEHDRHLRPWSPPDGSDAPGGSLEQHQGHGYGQAAGQPRGNYGTAEHEGVDGDDGDDEMTNADEDENQQREIYDDDDEMTNIDGVSSVGSMTIGSMTNADSVISFDAAANAGDIDGRRRYHRYHDGRYPLPNDDVEQFREISKHWVHMELTDGKLFNAPIDEYPQRIMDLCTGTGQWPVAAADEYPSAEVIGVDLSPIQPLIVPPNLRFILDDVEDEWLDRGGYDLIHMRFSAMYIRDIHKLLRNIYDHLKPGGWVEFADFGFKVFCDDGTMPKGWGFNVFTILGHQAFLDGGLHPDSPDEQGENFHQAGFINIQSDFKVTPIGEWPEDPKQKAIGVSFRDNLIELVNASPKPLSATGLDDNEIELFLVGVRKSLYDSDVHAHMIFKSWWAQKPFDEE